MINITGSIPTSTIACMTSQLIFDIRVTTFLLVLELGLCEGSVVLSALDASDGEDH